MAILPEKISKPVPGIDAHALLIHGEKKIGKTTLAMQGGKTLFLQFDPPQRSYFRYETYCKDWQTFIKALDQLERNLKKYGSICSHKGKLVYNRVCVDGADLWFRRCQDYVCQRKGWTHPSDGDYGKGWDAQRTELLKGLQRVLALPCSVWFLCHSYWKEVELRDKRKVDRLLPRLTGQAEEILNGAVDGWFAYDMERDGQRILIVDGDDFTGAGHRMDIKENPHFRCKRTGKRIKKIRMGSSPEEAYVQLVKGYENELERPVKKSKKKMKGVNKGKKKTEKER